MRPEPVLCLLALAAACGGGDSAGAGRGDGAEGFDPPVLTNPETPVRYPPQLFAQRTEGTVVLRLFVDERGRVVVDSTRIMERSGHDALDSAALAAVPAMRFAPARRDGAAVATAFLQPVHFRHPESAGTGGS
jgi:protein TonB